MIDQDHAVSAGVKLLLQDGIEIPANLDKLNMGHVSKCILALLYGSYSKGKRALGITSNKEAAEYGFWYDPAFSTKPEMEKNYLELTIKFREKLQSTT